MAGETMTKAEAMLKEADELAEYLRRRTEKLCAVCGKPGVLPTGNDLLCDDHRQGFDALIREARSQLAAELPLAPTPVAR